MIWHNTDQKLTDVGTTIDNLRKIRSNATVFKYTEIRREPTPTGFVQQHLLLVSVPGREIRDLACCVCRVEGGRIVHMDAYHDSVATGAMPHKSPTT
jgi:ketosteroid isomerase-like protein